MFQIYTVNTLLTVTVLCHYGTGGKKKLVPCGPCCTVLYSVQYRKSCIQYFTMDCTVYTHMYCTVQCTVPQYCTLQATVLLGKKKKKETFFTFLPVSGCVTATCTVRKVGYCTVRQTKAHKSTVRSGTPKKISIFLRTGIKYCTWFSIVYTTVYWKWGNRAKHYSLYKF